MLSGSPPKYTNFHELIMDIWFMIINCLRGQLDEVCAHLDDMVNACLRFWAVMEEHADGDARRKWPEVELLAPMLVVSSLPPSLEGQRIRLLLDDNEHH